MKRRNRRIALDITGLAAGGDGVGRDETGRVTFVPRSVTGDRVLVQLDDERKQFARAHVVEVLEASPERVEASCEHFKTGACGGCQWQHVAAGAQRSAKEEIVDSGLRRAMEAGLVREALLEPCEPLGWRRRARLSYWARGPRVLGFFAPRSQKITDIAKCPQFAPGLQRGLELVRRHLLPGLVDRGEIELLLAEDGKVHVSVNGPAETRAVQELADEELIAGVIHGDTVLGAGHVELEFGTLASSNSFAQASRAGNVALCEQVSAALGDLQGKRVLELYAGSGNFTRLLDKARGVYAVEQSELPAGVEAAMSEQRIHWMQENVIDGCAMLAAESARFDVVLLDPPRTGAKEIMEAVIGFAPQTIVYVSCDVATLARDLETLRAGGYQAESAQPIDLMPQTSQVELVVRLTRQAQ